MLTRQFLSKLKGEVNYTLPAGHLSPEEQLFKLSRKIKVWKGSRHENIEQCLTFFKENNLNLSLDNFEIIMVVIRNPYDYIVSRFHYLYSNQQFNKGPAARIAAEGDFEKYALKAPRFFRIEGYLHDKNGKIPENLRIIRYEDFSEQINLVIEKHLKEPINFEKRVNFTKRKSYLEYYKDNPEVEQAVYEKFKFLFDKGYYSRIILK